MTKTSWYQLKNWIEQPAKKERDAPEIEILVIGTYLAAGSQNEVYQIVIGENRRPVRCAGDSEIFSIESVFAKCTCKGSLHGKPCRHIKAAWPIHLELAEPEIMEEF